FVELEWLYRYLPRNRHELIERVAGTQGFITSSGFINTWITKHRRRCAICRCSCWRYSGGTIPQLSARSRTERHARRNGAADSGAQDRSGDSEHLEEGRNVRSEETELDDIAVLSRFAPAPR